MAVDGACGGRELEGVVITPRRTLCGRAEVLFMMSKQHVAAS